MAKANIDRFYPGLIDEATLRKFKEIQYGFGLTIRGVPDHMHQTVNHIEYSVDETTTADLTAALELDFLMEGAISTASFRFKSESIGCPDENEDLLGKLHAESKHEDQGSCRKKSLAENTRTITVIAVVAGELSVKLYNSHKKWSKCNAEIHMHPGDVLVLDNSNQHSVVPVGSNSRISYSIPCTIESDEIAA